MAGVAAGRGLEFIPLRAPGVLAGWWRWWAAGLLLAGLPRGGVGAIWCSEIDPLRAEDRSAGEKLASLAVDAPAALRAPLAADRSSVLALGAGSGRFAASLPLRLRLRFHGPSHRRECRSSLLSYLRGGRVLLAGFVEIWCLEFDPLRAEDRSAVLARFARVWTNARTFVLRWRLTRPPCSLSAPAGRFAAFADAPDKSSTSMAPHLGASAAVACSCACGVGVANVQAEALLVLLRASARSRAAPPASRCRG